MRRYFPRGRRSATNVRELASDTLVAATDDLTLATFTVDRHLRTANRRVDGTIN
jgi:hypothetical protein